MTAQLLAALLAAAPYTVHEWGTFTVVVGENGAPLRWRPLAAPSDLPSFVHTAERFADGLRGRPRGKGEMSSTVRMETPVLYFYPRQEMTLEASVRFPQGVVTEWYPMARTWAGPHLDWGVVKLIPNSRAPLPQEAAPSHYYPAREVDAAVVEVCGTDKKTERDRFLFYRGVGDFTLPVRAALKGDQLSIEGPRGATLIFERRGNALGFSVAPSSGSVTIARPPLTSTVSEARVALQHALQSAGLYEREAKAMLATWNDSWFEEGLRVFSLMGTAEVERVLPLTLNPAPTESVRVLVARIEMLTPERQAAFAKEALAKPEVALKREGRFADPLLALAIGKAQGEQKARLEQTLTALQGTSNQALAH